MNIIDIQDNLKNLPEQALMQEMQQPTGSAPQFLVLGELKRRKQMRDDYNRQKNADMKTVAEEVVTAAGAPQEGIMQMARSLNPNTNMAQDTGLAQATPVTPTQAPQPQAPQMMSDGGIMRMYRGGRFGTDVEYNYKTFLQENNLNDTPYAQDMFARLKETMDDRYDADGPNNNPRIYDNAIGFERSPEGLASVSSDASDFMPDRAYSSQPAVPSALRRLQRLRAGLSELSIEPDAAFTPQTSPAEPLSILDQLRSSVYSNNPLEDALAGTGLDSNVIGTSVIDPVMNRINEAASREGMPSQTAADLANEVALRNREMASENAGRLTAEELLAPNPEAYDVTVPRRPQGQGISSFGVFDPIVERFKEIRSEDAARNAAAAEGDLGAFLDVGSENDPAFLSPFVENATEILGNPVERFKSEMAARQAAGERNYANAVQGVEALNQRIADAKAAGNEILAQQLTTARDQLGGTLRNQERADDVVEGILAIPQSINKAFQQSSLGVGLRGPDATARTLTALEAEQEAAKKAEATRERRLAELLGGATPTVMDAAEVAQEEFDQRPDTQDVKPAAESQRIAEAIEDTTTTPAATKDTTRDTTTDTSTSVGSSGRIAQMLEDRQKSAESDKWMALAQTGLALMASNQPTLGGAIGEAGLAGIGALQQSRQGMQDFEMDMLKLQTQIDAANRKSSSKGGLTAGNIISYVDDLARQQSDVQDKLDELDTGVFMGTEEQKEAIRKRLQTNLFQVNLELSTYRNALRGGQPSSGSSFDVTGGSQSTGN